MNKAPKPTAPELTILKAIWLRSPLSAREVHEKVEDELAWSFSSTRKTLDRMQEKGLLGSRHVHGTKVFEARVSKLYTLANIARDFARNVLELDGPLPVAMFGESKLLSEKDLKELKKILRDIERNDDE